MLFNSALHPLAFWAIMCDMLHAGVPGVNDSFALVSLHAADQCALMALQWPRFLIQMKAHCYGPWMMRVHMRRWRYQQLFPHLPLAKPNQAGHYVLSVSLSVLSATSCFDDSSCMGLLYTQGRLASIGCTTSLDDEAGTDFLHDYGKVCLALLGVSSILNTGAICVRLGGVLLLVLPQVLGSLAARFRREHVAKPLTQTQ